MIARLKVSGPYENLIVSRTICDQRELYRKHSKAVRGQVLLPPCTIGTPQASTLRSASLFWMTVNYVDTVSIASTETYCWLLYSPVYLFET